MRATKSEPMERVERARVSCATSAETASALACTYLVTLGSALPVSRRRRRRRQRCRWRRLRSMLMLSASIHPNDCQLDPTSPNPTNANSIHKDSLAGSLAAIDIKHSNAAESDTCSHVHELASRTCALLPVALFEALSKCSSPARSLACRQVDREQRCVVYHRLNRIHPPTFRHVDNSDDDDDDKDDLKLNVDCVVRQWPHRWHCCGHGKDEASLDFKVICCLFVCLFARLLVCSQSWALFTAL